MVNWRSGLSMSNNENSGKLNIGFIVGVALGLVAGLFILGLTDKNNSFKLEQATMEGRLDIIMGRVMCIPQKNTGQAIEWKCYPKEEIQLILNNIAVGGKDVR